MSVSLKVSRTELIDRLEKAEEDKHVAYIVAINKYDEEVAKKTEIAIKALRAKLDKGEVEFGYSGARVSVGSVKLKNSKPSKPDLEKIDAQLSKLKMAQNEFITVSDKSDYFRYLN